MTLEPTQSYGAEFLTSNGWMPSALTFTLEGEAAGYGRVMKEYGHAYDYRVATFNTWASHTFEFSTRTPRIIKGNFLQEYTHERLRIQKGFAQKETSLAR